MWHALPLASELDLQITSLLYYVNLISCIIFYLGLAQIPILLFQIFEYSWSQNETIHFTYYWKMQEKFVLVLNTSSRQQLSINHIGLYSNGMYKLDCTCRHRLIWDLPWCQSIIELGAFKFFLFFFKSNWDYCHWNVHYPQSNEALAEGFSNQLLKLIKWMNNEYLFCQHDSLISNRQARICQALSITVPDLDDFVCVSGLPVGSLFLINYLRT